MKYDKEFQGAGKATFGSARVGYGNPAFLNPIRKKVYTKHDGLTQGDSAFINPLTGKYELDERGNVIGGDSIQQMVYLALFTSLNSSVVEDFGIDFNDFTQTVTPSLQYQLRRNIFNALRHLTSTNKISIVDIIIERSKLQPNKLDIEIRWLDVVKNEENQTVI